MYYYNSYVHENLSAIAEIHGSPLAPNLRGTVLFKDVVSGVMVYVRIFGLPEYTPAQGNRPPIGPHGFHIHDTGKCESPDPGNPFASAGGHYNPTNQPHGNHAGDFPVLFSNNGISIMSFFSNKFNIKSILGKSVVIHQNPDDYRTQPAGDSGKRIGCGIIQTYNYDSTKQNSF